MAVVYDPRRPRLPKELAGTIDRLRGQMPFNAFVVRALEMSLEDVNAGDDPLGAPEPPVTPREGTPVDHGSRPSSTGSSSGSTGSTPRASSEKRVPTRHELAMERQRRMNERHS